MLLVTFMSRDYTWLHFTEEEAEVWLGQKKKKCRMALRYLILGPGLPFPEFFHLVVLPQMFLSQSPFPILSYILKPNTYDNGA